MKSTRHDKHKQLLLASHQRSWLWGRQAVLELLRAAKWLPLELYLDAGLEPELLERTTATARRLRIPLRVVEKKRLTALCHQEEHQGFLALMPEFPYCALPQLLAGRRARPRLIAVLDRVQDAYNFGAILRSAEALGVAGVLIGAKAQCGVNSLAARASSGAAGRVAVARAEDLGAALDALHESGWHLAAADARSGADCREFDFRRDVALIIGNEHSGVAGELLARCAERVRIPQQGRIGSLNAAMAAAILFYEASRQRGRK